MGDTFLRSFISIYDYENKRVGLVLHKNSKATVTKPGSSKGGMKAWVIVLIVIVVLALVAVIGYLVYKARKNKLEGTLGGIRNSD